MSQNPIPKRSPIVSGSSSPQLVDSDNDNEIRNPFRSLSPINDADQSGNYCSALLWALDNRDSADIKNIALTGPYGSGKSSILRTFVTQAKKKRNDLHFLNISLATFKESTEQSTPKKKGADELEDAQFRLQEEAQLLRQIEYSILQQIFYHVRHVDIPHTRFRKQRSLSEEQARQWTSGIFLFILALLFELYHNEFWSILGILPHRVLQIYYHGIAWLFLGICTYNFIKQTVNSLHTIRLRKFNIKSAEFGVENNFEKSILNEHLDEILYFFDATAFNVVIIEDLDRFNKPEIFTKLREINQLINNKVDRKTMVTFIYAVKDDMFMDRNRTKFFDFIIPVIPIVGPTNSNEILRRLISENNYPIDTDLVDGIASYVDDMRLLFNIMNEFYIYRQSLNENLNQNKLLALILYKNTYPQDFVALSNREGKLYEAISEREVLVGVETNKFDERLQHLHDRREDLLASSIKSHRDLRKLYLLEILTGNDLVIEFDHRGTSLSFSDILEEQNFLLLISGQVKTVVQLPGEDNYEIRPIDFVQIEKSLDSEETFAKKSEALRFHQKMQLIDIEKLIEATEHEKSSLRSNSIKKLMEQNLINLQGMPHKQEQLVSILLRSGYIDEYFESYIAIFYPESISRSDADFMLNIQAKIRTDFDYPLSHTPALVSKLKEIEFEREFVLNYRLVDHLLQKKSSGTKREKVFKMLGNESAISIQFIDGYIKRGKKLDLFIAALVQSWENIWKFYLVNEHRRDVILPKDFRTLIIKYGNVADLAKIAKKTDLKSYIENRANFLSIAVKGRKMEDLIGELNIKFKDIDMNQSPPHLLNYIFSWNFYEINEIMIRKWYMFHDGSEPSNFASRNYTVLKDSLEVDPLIDYIENNLQAYIENVWLKLDEDQHEYDEYFEELLVNDSLSNNLKFQIIEKCQSKVPDVSKFADLDIVKMLLRFGKIVPTWLNLLRYYVSNDQQFDSFIIGFLNMDYNAMELQIETIDGKSEIDDDTVHQFAKELILCNSIEDMCYSDLLESIPLRINSGFDFSHLTENKVQSLLYKLETSPENFQILKKAFPGLIVEFIEENVDRFISEIKLYDLDTRDLRGIIQSENLSANQKAQVIQSMNTLVIANDFILMQEIAEQMFIHKNLELGDGIMRSIVTDKDIPIQHRINACFQLFGKLSIVEIKNILRRWEEPYNRLIGPSEILTFKHKEVDYVFLKLLFNLGVIKDLKTTKAKVWVHI